MSTDTKEEGITKFDIFRFTPTKLLENTVCGALLTVTFLVFSGILIY
jgi:hypothetical protein